MYILNKFFSYLGVVIAALSTVFCPFVKVPISGNWNMYQTDISLFSITIVFLAIAFFLLFLKKVTLYRFISVAFAAWCVLAFCAVYFKINNYFGMRFFDGLLAKTLHIRWGWFFLFLGAAIMLLSTRKVKEIK